MAHAYGHSVCLTEENVIYSQTTVSFGVFLIWIFLIWIPKLKISKVCNNERLADRDHCTHSVIPVNQTLRLPTARNT